MQPKMHDIALWLRKSDCRLGGSCDISIKVESKIKHKLANLDSFNILGSSNVLRLPVVVLMTRYLQKFENEGAQDYSETLLVAVQDKKSNSIVSDSWKTDSCMYCQCCQSIQWMIRVELARKVELSLPKKNVLCDNQDEWWQAIVNMSASCCYACHFPRGNLVRFH